MTLMDRAMLAIRQLPPLEQDLLARELLERIEADKTWDKLLADPRSPGTLARLVAEARADVANGDFRDNDPSEITEP